MDETGEAKDKNDYPELESSEDSVDSSPSDTEEKAESFNALKKREALITEEIEELNRKIKMRDPVAKIRNELDPDSPADQLIRARKKIKKLENDRKILMKDNSSLRENLRRAREAELANLSDSQFEQEVMKGGSFRLAAWIQLARKRLKAANIYTIENRYCTIFNDSQTTTLNALVDGKKQEFLNELPPFLQSTVTKDKIFTAVPSDLILKIIEEDNDKPNFCTVFALHHSTSPDSCNLPDRHLDMTGTPARHGCPLCKSALNILLNHSLRDCHLMDSSPNRKAIWNKFLEAFSASRVLGSTGMSRLDQKNSFQTHPRSFQQNFKGRPAPPATVSSFKLHRKGSILPKPGF